MALEDCIYKSQSQERAPINKWILNYPTIDSIHIFTKSIVFQNKEMVVGFMLEDCICKSQSQDIPLLELAMSS